MNTRKATRMRDGPTHQQGEPTEDSTGAGKEARSAPVHPGEILESEFLEPLALTANELADHLHLRVEQVDQLLRGERGVTAADALRLARYFDTTPEFWLNLQAQHDLEVARERLRHELEAITPRPGDA